MEGEKIRDHEAVIGSRLTLDGTLDARSFDAAGNFEGCRVCGESAESHAAIRLAHWGHDEVELRTAVERLSPAARDILRPILGGDRYARAGVLEDLARHQDQWGREFWWMSGLLVALSDSERQIVARLIDEMGGAEI